MVNDIILWIIIIGLFSVGFILIISEQNLENEVDVLHEQLIILELERIDSLQKYDALLNESIQYKQDLSTCYTQNDDLTKKYLQLQTSTTTVIESYEDILQEPVMCDIWNGYEQIYEQKRPTKGVYWQGSDFYCVWADKLPLSEQDKIDRHEYAHYLVDTDYTHFCEVSDDE